MALDNQTNFKSLDSQSNTTASGQSTTGRWKEKEVLSTTSMDTVLEKNATVDVSIEQNVVVNNGFSLLNVEPGQEEVV